MLTYILIAMAVELYDTLTRTVRTLSAEDGTAFRMYCCGPTVYKPSHIGHFRTFLVQDVLRRVLELDGQEVYHVRNITDVDDKTIRDSIAAGEDLRSFTSRWTEAFQEECAALNMLVPHQEPRATDHIDEQIRLIERLVEKGLAYAANDGSVYFKVAAFAEYGKLANLDPDQLRTQAQTSGGERNLADEYDRDTVADFALWKARKPEDGDNYWPSPWGEGRPGWHIECSAMSMKYLGETFDLHGGGVDLCFPHHENEIAQSEGATEKPFCRHWFHSAHLMVEGRKMSKSLDNFHTVQDVLDRGYNATELRYQLISAHYRQQLNFTWHGMEATRSGLTKLHRQTQSLLDTLKLGPEGLSGDPRDEPGVWGVFEPAWEALRHDLNLPACLGELFRALNSNPERRDDVHGLRKILFALGFELDLDGDRSHAPEIPETVRTLAEARWAAKQEKDFARADALRDEIHASGWSVLDRKDGYDLVKT